MKSLAICIVLSLASLAFAGPATAPSAAQTEQFRAKITDLTHLWQKSVATAVASQNAKITYEPQLHISDVDAVQTSSIIHPVEWHGDVAYSFEVETPDAGSRHFEFIIRYALYFDGTGWKVIHAASGAPNAKEKDQTEKMQELNGEKP